MADVTQKSSRRVEADVDDEPTPSTSDIITATDVTPSTHSENKVAVNQGAGEILETSERETSARAVFRDAKNQEDRGFDKRGDKQEEDVSSSGRANEAVDVSQCKDPTTRNREDSSSISRAANENNEDINAALGSSHNIQFTVEATRVEDRDGVDQTAHVVTTSHPAAADVVATTSHNVRDFPKILTTDGVDSIISTESFPERSDGVPGAVMELNAADASVEKEIPDETVAGVTGDDFEGRQANVGQQAFSQEEKMGQTQCGASDEPSSKARSEIDDVCDESFEEIGEIGSAVDWTTGHDLNETAELVKGTEQAVKKVDERSLNEEEEQAWSSEVETALSEAMEQVLNEGKEETLCEPVEQQLSEPIEQRLSESIEQQLSEPIEQRLSEQIEQQLSEPIEQRLSEPIEQQLSEPIEQQLSEPIEQQLSEPIEQQLSEPIEQQLSEPTEQQLSEPIEQRLSEPIEQMLNEPLEKNLSQSIEQTLSETIEQTESEPIQKTLSETIEQTLSEPIEQTLSEPIDESFIELNEQSLNECREEEENESKEQALNKAMEQVLLEAKEQSLNEAKEQSSNEAKKQSLNEAKEQSLNEAKEQSLNEAKEQSLNEVKEQSLNEAKEQSLNEAREQALNATKELSFGANQPGLSSPEKKAGHKFITSESKDERLEESTNNPSGQTDQETGQPLKEIGKGSEVAEVKTKAAPGIQDTEIPMSEPHGTEDGVASEREIPQLHRIEESVTPEGRDGLARLHRVAEEMVTALVSEACSSVDRKVSETVVDASVQNEAPARLECLEHVEAKMKSTPASGGTDHGSDEPSNVGEADTVNEVTSSNSTMGPEEIDSMASYRNNEPSENRALSPDTEADEMEKINFYNSKTKDAEDPNVKEIFHREAGDTPMAATNQREGDDVPTAESGEGEGAIDNPSNVIGSQCITTSTTPVPDDEKQLRTEPVSVPETQKNFDATEFNADAPPEKLRPSKDGRGICVTALMLSGVVLTGFGCAVAAPFAIAALGFEAGGIAAGSLAAGLMSAASSSGVGLLIVSALEAAGISGLGLGAQVLIGAAGAGTAGGLVAAAELFKRKSTNVGAVPGYGNPDQGAGEASEKHLEEEHANNDEDDESDNNDDNSYEEDSSDESTDDVTADIQNGVTLMEDSDGNGRDENGSNVEAITREDTFQNECDEEETHGNGAGSRRKDKQGDDAVLLGQDVVHGVQINEEPPLGRNEHDEVSGEIRGAQDSQRVIAEEVRSDFVSDDLAVSLGDESPKDTHPVEHLNDSGIGGVTVEPHEGDDDDDYTDNPWKAERDSLSR